MSFLIRNIQMTLDPESIENAINEVNLIRDRLKPAMMRLIEELARKGVEIARAELIFFDDPAYWTGALSESIRYSMDEQGSGATITAGEGCYAKNGASYAMYVEFGTGIVGQNSAANPEATGIGTYRESGWVYFNEDIGNFVYTTGMAARPFMHNTFLDLQEEVKTIGGRIVAEYLADGE